MGTRVRVTGFSRDTSEVIDEEVFEWQEAMQKKYGKRPEGMELYRDLKDEKDRFLDILKSKYKLSDTQRDSYDEGYLGDIIGDMAGINPDTGQPY